MPTYYLDYTTGNNAADGSTFATGGLPTVGPWKDITSGATAARIAPGDIIKIGNNTNVYDETGALVADGYNTDPVSVGQSATFTNLSRDVVLVGADLPEDTPRANPTVIHYHSHGLSAGQQVTFSGITQSGWTALNGNIYNITYIDADNFSIAIDSTGYAADLATSDPGKCIILPCKEIDHCASTYSNWVLSTDVTGGNDTSIYKLGSNSFQLNIGASFTTGKLAYRDFGAGNELDLSGYQQISFWFRNSVALSAAGDVSIKLCSDASGDTPVDTFSLPAIPSTAYWVCLTLDKGSALGSSIQSIAIYINVDRGAMDLNFDNIIACKARTADDSLSLQSLISKNSAKQGGTEPWYCIQSISGATIKIDNHTNQLGSFGKGYTGSTEAQPLYRRETIKTLLVPLAVTPVQEIQVSGTRGSLIEYKGGYSTSSGLQDSETIFDGSSCVGVAIGTYSNKKFAAIDNIRACRYAYGLYLSNTFEDYKVSNYGSLSCNSGMSMSGSPIYLDGIISIVNCSTNFSTIGDLIGLSGSHLISVGCVGARGINASGGYWRLDEVTVLNNNGFHIESYINTLHGSIKKINFDSTPLFRYGSAMKLVVGETSCSGTPYILSYLYPNWQTQISIQKFNGSSSDIRIYEHNGVIYSETSIRHTASGFAWKFSPTVSTDANEPVWLKIAEIAVNADALVTVKAWMRRSNTGLTMSLVCRGGQIAGVTSDVTASMTAAADTWEEITITFTPTEAGVVEIEAWAYGGTTYSGYVDDMTITQV